MTDRTPLAIAEQRLLLLGPERPDEDEATARRRSELTDRIYELRKVHAGDDRLPYREQDGD